MRLTNGVLCARSPRRPRGAPADGRPVLRPEGLIALDPYADRAGGVKRGLSRRAVSRYGHQVEMGTACRCVRSEYLVGLERSLRLVAIGAQDEEPVVLGECGEIGRRCDPAAEL